MVIFGPRGRGTARRWGGHRRRHRGAKTETRGYGEWKGKREKARGRIEIGPWKSSGTRPTFGCSCDRSSLSLFLPFTSSSLLSFLLFALFFVGPPPRSNPFSHPRFLPFLFRPPRFPWRWIFTSGEIRDINSRSMATFTATTQIVLTGNEPQAFQEDNG